MQQAGARLGLRSALHGLQRPPRDVRLDRGLRRHAAIRSGGRARRARRRRRDPGHRDGGRRIPIGEFHTCCRPSGLERYNVLAPRRADRGDRGLGSGAALGLPEGARARVLRVRDGVGRRDRRARRRRRDPTARGSRSARSRIARGGCDEAERRLVGMRARRPRRPARRSTQPSSRRGRSPTTPTRSRSHATLPSGRSNGCGGSHERSVIRVGPRPDGPPRSPARAATRPISPPRRMLHGVLRRRPDRRPGACGSIDIAGA